MSIIVHIAKVYSPSNTCLHNPFHSYMPSALSFTQSFESKSYTNFVFYRTKQHVTIPSSFFTYNLKNNNSFIHTTFIILTLTTMRKQTSHPIRNQRISSPLSHHHYQLPPTRQHPQRNQRFPLHIERIIDPLGIKLSLP